MKQRITKEQWAELKIKEQDKLVNFFLKDWKNLPDLKEDFKSWEEMMFDTAYEHTPLDALTIGQLIEFLGDDWFLKIYMGSQTMKTKEMNPTKWYIIYKKVTFHYEKLIDALWEATKYKLNAKEKT